MLHYIIQTVAFQLFFLLIYDVFLKKETFFNWNRIYLITTVIISILMPFIKIDGFKDVLPKEYIINLPEVILGNTSPSNATLVTLDTVTIQASKSIITWENIGYLGIILATCLFIFKIIKILRLFLKNPKSKVDNVLIVNLLNSNAAFSFFRYIFLGEHINEIDKTTILKHEIVHVKQNHTLDLLFFEILRILFWFNPLVYMYQNRIMVLHEFIADQEAVKHQEKSHYYQNLLSQVFDTQNISFINPFFHQSLIKKRIVMLQKSKSKQVKLLKYALLIPLVFGMLIYTSCAKEEIQNSNNELSISQQIKALSESVKANNGNLTDEEKNSLNALLEEMNLITLQIRKTANFKIDSSGAAHEDDGQVEVPVAVIEHALTLSPSFQYRQVEVPFAVIENVPVFPGCENSASNDEKRKCMSVKIQEFVVKNFNNEIAKENNLTGRQRITVMFKIDTEGNITNIQSRAPHPSLEAEAIRVVKLLPKMIPGKQRGENVTVPYSLPIVFVAE